MGRPRTPTEILELRGAYRKDPQRRRPVGPKSEKELGQPPSHLTKLEVTCWNELERNIIAGVLTSAERWTVEIASRLMARLRTDWLTGAEFAQLSKALSSLGMTPADRSKVHVEATKQASPFDELLQ